jgi:hypothetical protein
MLVTGLKGVVHEFAQSRGRMVVTDVPQRLDHGLTEEERNSRLLLTDPIHKAARSIRLAIF